MTGPEGHFRKLRIGSIAAVSTLMSHMYSPWLSVAQPESLVGGRVHDGATDICGAISGPPHTKRSAALHGANKGCCQTLKRYMLANGELKPSDETEKLTFHFNLKRHSLLTALKKVNLLSRCSVPCVNNRGRDKRKWHKTHGTQGPTGRWASLVAGITEAMLGQRRRCQSH